MLLFCFMRTMTGRFGAKCAVTANRYIDRSIYVVKCDLVLYHRRCNALHSRIIVANKHTPSDIPTGKLVDYSDYIYRFTVTSHFVNRVPYNDYRYSNLGWRLCSNHRTLCLNSICIHRKHTIIIYSLTFSSSYRTHRNWYPEDMQTWANK